VAVHDVAQRGFGGSAEEYERFRPSYPADAFSWLAERCRVTPGTRVCDVGAGTGKLTRLVSATGVDVVAAEPLAEMLMVLHRELPDVPAALTVAEAMPFEDGAFGAVLAAQAFHWFDLDRALPEVHRVLEPGGRLGLLWNGWDVSVDWVRETRDLLARSGASEQWLKGHLDDHWLHDAVGSSSLFGDLRAAAFHHSQHASRDAVIERVATSSHIAAKPPAERKAVLDAARSILDRAGGDDVLEFPYQVDAYWCERAA
jgi:SAM-dependent methyltransferase